MATHQTKTSTCCSFRTKLELINGIDTGTLRTEPSPLVAIFTGSILSKQETLLFEDKTKCMKVGVQNSACTLQLPFFHLVLWLSFL